MESGLLTGMQTLNLSYGLTGDSVDGVSDTPVTFDSAGKIIAFDDGEGTVTFGTASIVDSQNDGIIAWSRWTNGVTGGSGFLAGRDVGSGKLGEGSLHLIAGTPTSSSDMTNLQIGAVTATYTLLGGTSPTDQLGNVGTLNSGSLTAFFGTGKVNTSLNIGISSQSYTITGTNMSISGSTFSSSSATAVGGGCSVSCPTDINGFFAGSNAARAGLVYHFQDSSFITGAAGFKR